MNEFYQPRETRVYGSSTGYNSSKLGRLGTNYEWSSEFSRIFSPEVRSGLDGKDDSQLLNLHFFELRREIRQLQQDAQTGPSPNSTSIILDKSKLDAKINLKRRQSLYIAFRLCDLTGMKKVDLHGLYLDDAIEVVELIVHEISRIMETKDINR